MIVLFVLAAMTIVVFRPVGRAGFINYDDDIYVYENRPVASGLSREGIAWAFTTTHASNWHPLTWISHMIDVELFGMDPGRHHLVNLIIHLLNVILLFWALLSMTSSLFKSGMTAALFAVHPLHVESVAWVAERKDVLCTAFWFLTILAYIFYTRRPGAGRYLPVMFAYALALMSKPMPVTLPFVLLLLDYWPLGRAASSVPPEVEGVSPVRTFSAARLVAEKVPLLVMAGFSGVITYSAQIKGGAVAEIGFTARLMNIPLSYIGYIWKMILPRQMSIFYTHQGEGTSLPASFAALFLLVLISLLVFVWKKRRPYMAVGWAWYLGTLVPVIGLVQVGGQAMADRYTYITLTGLFIMAVWGSSELAAGRHYGRAALRVLAASVLLVLMIIARRQTGYWIDSEKLFSHAIEVTRDNYMAHHNLGVFYEERGEDLKAITQYGEALRIRPRLTQAHLNIGRLLAGNGKPEEAMSHYVQALSLEPQSAKIHNDMGYFLEKEGKKDEAVSHYREAIRIDPEYSTAHYNLGFALISRGDVEGSVGHYREALRIDPYLTDAHVNLAVILSMQKRFDEAAIHYREALRIDPENVNAHYNFGIVLSAMGELEQSETHYREVLRIKPDHAKAHHLLGEILIEKGDLDGAVHHLKESLRIDPKIAPAGWSLKRALLLRKRKIEGME